MENQAGFDEAMMRVGEVSKGSRVWIGVGVVGRWRDHDGVGEGEGEGRSGREREKKSNGMVLVGPEGKVVGSYRKRKTVPSE